MKQSVKASRFSIYNLTTRAIEAGNLSAKGYLVLSAYYFKMITALPLSFSQKLFYSKKIEQTQIETAPIIILGHYRSGTTYLHKLMTLDPTKGYISNFDMICPQSSLLLGKPIKNLLQRLINTLNIKTSFFNNYTPQMDEPAEEDRLLMNKASAYSCYWGFIFPRKWHEWLNEEDLFNSAEYTTGWKAEQIQLLKQASFNCKGKQLVLKNPPNTGRVNQLLELFPNAKFVYISRNPIDVFYSMRNMWTTSIRQFCLQAITKEQIEEIILGHFEFLINRYEEQKRNIPAGNLVEVKYEELETNPLKTVEQIYQKLNLANYELAAVEITKKLPKESKYKKFTHRHSEETSKRVEERWKAQIRLWRELPQA